MADCPNIPLEQIQFISQYISDKDKAYEIAVALFDKFNVGRLPNTFEELTRGLKWLRGQDIESYNDTVKNLDSKFYKDYYDVYQQQKDTLYEEMGNKLGNPDMTIREANNLLAKLKADKNYSLLDYRVKSYTDSQGKNYGNTIDVFSKSINVRFSKESTLEDWEQDKESTVYKNRKTGEEALQASAGVDNMKSTMERTMTRAESATYYRFKKDFPSPNMPLDELKTKTVHDYNPITKKMEDIGYDDYMKFKSDNYESKRVRGNIVHTLLNLNGVSNVDEKTKLTDLLYNKDTGYYKQLGMTDEDIKKEEQLVADIYTKYIKYDEDTAMRFDNEFKVALQGLKLSYKDKDGTEKPLVGMMGTIDKILYHHDGTYSIQDYKSGKLNDTASHIFEFDDSKTVTSSDLHMAELKNVLYAMMFKSTVNKDARFRSINLLKIGNDSIAYKDMLDEKISGNVRIGQYLNIIKNYLKSQDPDFVRDNSNLFNADNYKTKLIEENKVIDGKIAPYNVQYKKLLEELQSTVDDLAYKKSIRRLSDEENATYKMAVQNLIAHTYGTDVMENMHMMKGIGLPEGKTIPIQDVNNAFTKPISRFYVGRTQEYFKDIADFTTEYEKRLKSVVKKTMVHSKATYREDYGWMWKDYGDIDEGSSGGMWLKTYKDDEWKQLTPDQKRFADYHRWMIRYNLMSAVDTVKGIEFINAELKERTDLSKEDRDVLEKQKEILENNRQVEKWKGTRLNPNMYFEGWTPRSKIQSEEMEWKDYLRKTTKDATLMDQYADNGMNIDRKEGKTVGLPLRHNNNSSDSGVLQREGTFTFNPAIITAEWAHQCIRKRCYDDVINMSNGMVDFLKDTDAYSDKQVHKSVIDYLEKWMDVQLYNRQKTAIDNVLLRDKDGNVKKEFSMDKLIRSLRSTVGVTILACKYVSGLRTGVKMSTQMGMRALAGSISDVMFNTNNAQLSMGSPGRSTFESLKLLGSKYFGKNDTKMAEMMADKGFFVESYDYQNFDKSKFMSVTGRLLGKKITKDSLFFQYRLIHDFVYGQYFHGLMSKLMTTKNGKKICMYDAYEKNAQTGKWEYTGDDRGVDATTGEKITGLTIAELMTMKKYTRENIGAMRHDERVALEGDVLSASLIQFRHYFPAMIKAAWKGRAEQGSLVKYMANGKYMVTDEVYKDGTLLNKIIEKDSDEYKQLEKDNVRMLPMLKETEQISEGYIRTLVNAGIALRYLITDPKAFKEHFASLSDYQKTNLVFAINKLAMYGALGIVLNNILGDADHNRSNKWIQAAHNARNELAFEYLFTDYKNLPRTILAAPTLEKPLDMIGSVATLTYSYITGDRVRSGEHKGWYKGAADLMKSTPFVSAGYDVYDAIEDWGTIQHDAHRAIMSQDRVHVFY